MVCPACGMTTWVNLFGCALPGCENYGVLLPVDEESEDASAE